MSKDFGPGIFEMRLIRDLEKVTNLELAKQQAQEAVDNSLATAKNKAAATAMISKSRSVKSLLFGMTNFSLSHQGLKLI
jgi:hypothetical protein